MFSTFSVQRLSAGSVYKLLGIGLGTASLPLGLLAGVTALFGADTVRWNNAPIHGVTALVAGPLMGIVIALIFSALLGTVAVLGLWLYSKVRRLSLSARGLQPGAASDA